jgi:ABC-2 type transport system permease protein
MNMMFSALFGVGYVVVSYRKNGVLKRMSVTPLRPWEFLTSQILSRMYLLLITTGVVFIGCKLIYGFQVRGSYLTLFLVFCLGGFSMISLALVVASRSGSEEFAGGILNLITWPMMFLSEVWFSLEGTEPWVQKAARIFPLTHMIDAARKIMNDGAGIREVYSQLIILACMSLAFLVIGSLLFKWQKG